MLTTTTKAATLLAVCCCILTHGADTDDLAGRWLSPCIPNGTATTQVGTIDYQFTDSLLVAVYKVYWAPDCGASDDHLWTDSLRAIVRVVDTNAATGDDVRIDVVVMALMARAESSDAADGANQIEHYGYSDWEPGVVKDVAGRVSGTSGDTNAAVGEIRFGLLRIVQDSLFVGNLSGPF
ncbi:MAG: hypothetical protein GF331_19675, partial [Chitinivibrionales bacterium]|nr:hypothetical protein [Chitinivibrionales bacterium]